MQVSAEVGNQEEGTQRKKIIVAATSVICHCLRLQVLLNRHRFAMPGCDLPIRKRVLLDIIWRSSCMVCILDEWL